MEAACLFTLSSIYKVKAGAGCVVIADRVANTFKVSDELEEKAGIVASEAIKILASNK